jgi:hypothetical protein
VPFITVHWVLQLPQWLGSLVVSTHEPPQFVWPWEQIGWQTDCEQTWPLPQACPQLPQLLLSLVRSTHAPLHAVLLEGQLHTPLVHVAPPGQAWPHRPQLWTFVWRFTHAFEQLVCPLGQAVRQWPPEQTWLVRQTWPQNPQFLGSWASATQAAEHTASPTGQAQCPAVQCPPTGQTWAQRPQLWALV